jgi:sugar lactone lactonase YvrE
MKRIALMGAGAALIATGGIVLAQEEATPFEAGPVLGVNVDDVFVPLSDNVKVYGGIVNAESCAYDPVGGHIVAINRGASNNRFPNDGFISLINSDGTVHAPRWVRFTNDNGVVINHPLGSHIADGVLYILDYDGGERTLVVGRNGAEFGPSTDREAHVRMFDMATGAPLGGLIVPDSRGFNDLTIAADGTIYATESSRPGRIFQVNTDGTWSVLIEGDVLNRPNGIDFDNDGNLVVVMIGSDEVLTFNLAGELLMTEHAVQSGSDGLVIMADGTKYVSSVRLGGVSMIPPGGEAVLIAEGIPNAASMCYDSGANQLVIPMSSRNSFSYIQLGM